MRFLVYILPVLQFLSVGWCKRIDLGPYQELILDQHNDYRREEQASNMMMMKWNDSLAAAASSWAERCDFKHEMKSKLGENLAFDTREFETDKLLDGLMTGWHDEKRMWKYGSQACGFPCHFTQLVWHSTNTVGCAATRCPAMSGMMGSIKNAFYLVCFYFPRGNWVGQVAYIPGRACSKCGTGATCKQDLCDSDGAALQLAAAPAPVALKQSRPSQSNARRIVSFSRYETFSHGTGANRKTVRRGSSILHRSGPQNLLAPQALTAKKPITFAGQTRSLTIPSRGHQIYSNSAQTRLRSRHSKTTENIRHHRQRHNQHVNTAQNMRNDSQRTRSGQRHTSRRHNTKQAQDTRNVNRYSKTDQNTRHKASNKAGKRKKRLCRDRLPACWKWADRCGTNRAMKVMCPKSCDACEMVFSIVDAKRKQNKGGNKPEVRSGSVGHHRQTSRTSHRRGHRGSRHQNRASTTGRQTTVTGRQTIGRQTTSRQTSGRQTTDRRQHKHKKTNAISHKKPQNSVLQGKDNPSCRDNPNFATRCGYWAKTGFCKENYMMRDMYCKKSCGNC